MLNRRDLFKLGLGTWIMSQGVRIPFAGAGSGAQGTSRPQASKPRYYVFVFLAGGLDAVLSVDPKTRSQVESWADVPYRSSEIVTAANLHLGPQFAKLAKWAPQMSIVNGVQVFTANHKYGTWQSHRLKTFAVEAVPPITDILGAQRDGQPLSTITLGNVLNDDYGHNWFGSGTSQGFSYGGPPPSLFDEIDGVAPADLEKMAAALRVNRKQLSGGGATTARALENIDQVIALFDRLQHTKAFAEEDWGDGSKDREEMAKGFQRMAWALENDLTKCAYLRLGIADWDTHFQNKMRQGKWNSDLVACLDRFLTALANRKNAHGTLASNTAIVMVSDVGRFPKVNPHDGKDHFPEVPFAFFGPWFRGGHAYGSTGRVMESRPISLATGAAEKGGHMLRIDDIGAHMLRLEGLKPELYGYQGERLQFLEAS